MIELTHVYWGMYSIQHWRQATAESKNLSTTLIKTDTHAALRSAVATIAHHNPDQQECVVFNFIKIHNMNTQLYSYQIICNRLPTIMKYLCITNLIQHTQSYKKWGHAMVQAVSHQALIAEAQV